MPSAEPTSAILIFSLLYSDFFPNLANLPTPGDIFRIPSARSCSTIAFSAQIMTISFKSMLSLSRCNLSWTPTNRCKSHRTSYGWHTQVILARNVKLKSMVSHMVSSNRQYWLVLAPKFNKVGKWPEKPRREGRVRELNAPDF